MSAPDVTIYMHRFGPNGWKVVYVLEELNVTYKPVYLDFSKNEHKAPEYMENICENGRIPALVDHRNNDFKLWESAAILMYLAEMYDKDKILTPATREEQFKINQWLIFQASGQGPYFGQAAFFILYNKDHPKVLTRYQEQSLRVFGVLELGLKNSGTGFLVGNHRTIADIAFVAWTLEAMSFILTPANNFNDFNFEKDYPLTYKWHTGLLETPGIKNTLAKKAEVAKH